MKGRVLGGNVLGRLILCAILAIGITFFSGSTAVADIPELHPAIPLYDEAGDHVLDSGKPYSSRKSCGNADGGGCHDYDAITHAYHFEMGRDEAKDDFGEKRGLSYLVSPGYYGGYGCMGGSNQDVLAKKANASEDDFADKGSAGWVQRCNGCHQGGGWMEMDRNGQRYDETDPSTVTELDGDYFNRGTTSFNNATSVDTVSQWDWKKSGVVEADCMWCHGDYSNFKDGISVSTFRDEYRSGLRRHDLADEGFFREMGTAMFEFLNMKPSEEGADSTAVLFSRDEEGHLELDENGKPVLTWNASLFDENKKLTIPMLRFPGNDNCMFCHSTSNGRRGFYGFGEGAEAAYDEEGILVEDYQDDVHKGLEWTEANGVAKAIENCNSCHSRNYFRSASGNTDLDANHNILKGNSDMDVRNDLDYNPNALSCEYCHNNAESPAIPSGHDNMLDAHRELWKASDDMDGYPQDTLTRITETHLDVISCQACHIVGKKGRRGADLQILYRYRRGEDGLLKMMPYNPRIRYYWKDNNSGRMLNKTERNSIFELGEDNDGKKIGLLKNPENGETLGTVSARMSHGSWRFGDPEDYAGYVNVKNAYDGLLRSKGVTNPDAVMVWIESNEYIMSHNTRPAVDSVQCEDCHNRKQNGSFSSLISPDGLLGENVVKTVTTLPDKRLVDEGIVLLGHPYMKIDDDGVVTENMSDILYATKINPSLTILNAELAEVHMMEARSLSAEEAFGAAKILEADDIQAIKDHIGDVDDLFTFKPNFGGDTIRGISVLVEKEGINNSVTDLIFSTSKLEASIAGSSIVSSASGAGFGMAVSDVITLNLFDTSGEEVDSFGGKSVVVRIPYSGENGNKEEVKILYSANGSDWTALDASNILVISPQTEESDGYILFSTTHFSHYAVADSTVTDTSGDDSANGASAASDGGSCFIATAAYGSYEEPHVQMLRDFRDDILLTNSVGEIFVTTYYKYSPPMASWIAQHDTVRAIVRVALIPLYAFAYFLLKLGLTQQLLLMTLFFAVAISCVRSVRRIREAA